MYIKIEMAVFDKSGTFPACQNENYISYDSTGAFVGKEGRRVNPDKVIKIIADVNNVFDFINFFENDLDVEKIID